MKEQPTPITIRDFLENKFGYFNPAHPLLHLGYAKGLTPDIEDLINAFEEYLQQPTPAPVSAEESYLIWVDILELYDEFKQSDTDNRDFKQFVLDTQKQFTIQRI